MKKSNHQVQLACFTWLVRLLAFLACLLALLTLFGLFA
jgi:hypothetical protein